MRTTFRAIGATAALCVSGALATQVDGVEPATPIVGHLLIHGGGGVDVGARTRFFSNAGGADRARIVVVPTASRYADEPDAEDRYLGPWRPFEPAALELVHVGDRDPDRLTAAAERIAAATGVWLSGGDQSRLVEAYRGTVVADAMHAVLDRGGVVGGTSAGAACQSAVMIASGNPKPTLAVGFGFLPGTIVDQHFGARDRLPRLLAALAARPGRVGLGIDERTALEVHGRRLTVVGEGRVAVVLAAGPGRPETIERMEAGATIDLPRLRRAALDRTGPRDVAELAVPRGPVFVAGGGDLSPETAAAFRAACGGDDARILVVDAAGGERTDALLEALRAGTSAACRLHLRTGTIPLVEALSESTGVWFIGTRPWEILDAYESGLRQALLALVERGGAVGASGPVAATLASSLVRGDPLDDRVVFAEGYDVGIGLLAGFAIETRREAHADGTDLTVLVGKGRALYGIGVDTSAVAVVEHSLVRAFGEGTVHLVQPGADDEAMRAVLEPGDSFDFLTWRRR